MATRLSVGRRGVGKMAETFSGRWGPSGQYRLGEKGVSTRRQETFNRQEPVAERPLRGLATHAKGQQLGPQRPLKPAARAVVSSSPAPERGPAPRPPPPRGAQSLRPCSALLLTGSGDPPRPKFPAQPRGRSALRRKGLGVGLAGKSYLFLSHPGCARSAGCMAGAPDEREPGPATREQLHVSCQVFSEGPAQGKPQEGLLSSFPIHNQKCQLMLLKSLKTSRSRDLEAGGPRGGV
jgi:hypothetical protein